MPLPEPPTYTPWNSGVYQVAPALRPFGTDFGNGRMDQVLFQFDREQSRFRANKAACQRERSERHVGRHALSDKVESAARSLILARLRTESPDSMPPDDCPLDDLAMYVQEDLVIVSSEGARDWVSYVHVCSPSHWDPIEKLGLSFFDLHSVVPGFEKVNAASTGLIDAMLNKGPFVRFVWGVETDDDLNHHPDLPPGREFDSKPFLVRVERQSLWGMPSAGAALFVIRVGFVSGETVRQSDRLRDSLRSALLSMSPEARRYKGVDEHFDALLTQLA